MLYTAYIGVDVSWPLLQLLYDVNGPPARKADNNLRRVSRTIGQVRAVQLNSPCNLYSQVGKLYFCGQWETCLNRILKLQAIKKNYFL